MPVNPEALAAAKRGAAFLDALFPDGEWRYTVNESRLDMAEGTYVVGSGCGCVLSQLDAAVMDDDAGFYRRCALRLNIEPYGKQAHDLGFVADNERDAPFTWNELTDAWLEVLA